MNIDQILNLFNGKKKTGKGWLVQCPLHRDDTASLHIAEDGERLLVKCFAGCDTSSILDFINGKDMSGFKVLSTDTLKSLIGKEKVKPELEFVKSYVYTDEKGQLLYEILKYNEVHEDGRRKKTFKYRRPSTAQEEKDFGVQWVYSIEGCRRIPYNLPNLLASEQDDFIFIVDGEKDADSLTKRGLNGICFPFGSGKNKWSDEYIQYLKGKNVVLIPDNDKPGWDLCLDIALAIKGWVHNLYFLPLPVRNPKEDVTDYFEKYDGTNKSLLDLLHRTDYIDDYTDEQIKSLISFEEKPVDFDTYMPDNGQVTLEEQPIDSRYEEFIAELEKHESSLTFGLCEVCAGGGYATMVDEEGLPRIMTKTIDEQNFKLETCPHCNPQSFTGCNAGFNDLEYERADF